MLDPLHTSPAFRLHRVNRLLRAHLLRLLQPFELTPEQYLVLMRLFDRDGQVQGDLGDAALDDRASVSRQVSLLATRGLVERRSNPDDHRAVSVYLTEAGGALMRALEAPVAAERRRLFGDIAAEDLEALLRALDQLEATLERGS